MSGHTEGPWRFGEARHAGRSRIVNHGRGVGFVCEVECPTDGDRLDDATMDANAHLIAAAPDMLEALEEASHWFYGEHHPDHPTCVRIREALAKAKGDPTPPEECSHCTRLDREWEAEPVEGTQAITAREYRETTGHWPSCPTPRTPEGVAP